ncbi:MAG: alpha/beta hydrolase fold domain-containing protein [Aeromicrobium sp.]
MTLDPIVQAHLDAEEPLPVGADLAGLRAHLRRQLDTHFERFGLPGPPVDLVKDHVLTSRDGSSFRVRLYHPRPAEWLPVHVVVHGGGWVTGSIDELVVDATARHRAAAADVAVVSVDYRLAPEHPSPAALEDVVATLRWITDHGDALGLVASEISVGGASAGANLVAGAVLMHPSVAVRGMILEVPALDLTAAELVAEAADQAVDESMNAVSAYVPDPFRRADPFVSPLLAPSLASFPPTWVLTAGLDVLAPQGARFVERLVADGVPAELESYPGALHGSPILNGVWPTARRWHDDSLRILRHIHGRPEPTTPSTTTPSTTTPSTITEENVMDPELTAIVARSDAFLAEHGGGPDWPDVRPHDGQTREEWVAHVERLRRQHDTMTLEGARRLGTPAGPDVIPVGRVTYEEVPVDGGFVAARVYRPAGEGARPVILFFHGGGFWMAGGIVNFELNDTLCRGLSTQLGAIVVNVDYRLAPEHPYPTQLEDGFAALEWVVGQASSLGADLDRVAVMGVSSGGNLAASLAQLTRDRGGPAVAAQILLAPAIDMTTPRETFVIDPHLHDRLPLLRGYYAHDEADWTIPYLSPSLTDDLTKLPPAVVVTGEFDPLRGEGQAYVARLTEQGVDARNLDYPMTHTGATPEVMSRLLGEVLGETARLLS